jgi:MFS superfamily sulfate permease-like transporter
MNNKSLFIVLGVALAILVAGLVYMFIELQTSKKENREILELQGYNQEQLEQNKDELEGEFQMLSSDLQGFSVQVNNDSILKRLDEEQKRVQLLMEELRSTKATNVRRITELKAELATVRKVLTYYVAQVDSLSRLNTSLKTENVEVTRKFQQVTKVADSLAQEKEHLTEQVTRAAQLEARNISVEQQTKNGKKTARINKTDMLKVSFTVGKNITAQVGEKTVYIRISNPNNEVMFKKQTDTFHYENKDIVYSARKNFEYTGEETSQILYWTVEETLIKGAYRVDIFIDSHLVGYKEFTLD